MTRKAFEKITEIMFNEGKYFKITTSTMRNLGMNGQEAMTIDMGEKSVNNGSANYRVSSTFEFIEEDVLRIDLQRTTWIKEDKARKYKPTASFENTLFVDVKDITMITKN